MISFLNLLHQLEQESSSFSGNSPWASDYSVSSEVGWVFFACPTSFPRAQHLLHHMERQNNVGAVLTFIHSWSQDSVSSAWCQMPTLRVKVKSRRMESNSCSEFPRLRSHQNAWKVHIVILCLSSFWEGEYQILCISVNDPERWACCESDRCV